MNRIIVGSTDYTGQLNNYHANTVEIPASGVIYISSPLPLNHLFFDYATALVSGANVSLSYWGNGAWQDAVDSIDETLGMTANGFLQWTPNENCGWSCENTSEITGLTSVTIYGQYWIRITLDNAETFDLNWLGNIFCNDSELGDEHPELASAGVMASFSGSKTSYLEQEIVAAKLIVNDLRAKKQLLETAQILDRKDLTLVGVSKLAEIIYTHLGDAYLDQKTAARVEYKSRLNNSYPKIDKNKDGIDSGNAERVETGMFYR